MLIMSQTEMAVWWEGINMNPEKHARFKESLEELTGRNPVLLHAAAIVIKEEALGSELELEAAQHESELLTHICRCDA